jgi:crotonobetainyl-CoA:carnitine CoA-transferase CaiB-like acyl-CoA transferase
MSNKRDQNGLTPKQAHFARCVAGGMTQADAYREAYDPSDTTKPETIHSLASRVMARVEVRARVDAIIAAKERAVAVSALSDRDKVLSKLRQWVDGMPTDSNQLRAAELLGKASGTFTEQVSINQGDRDASEVAAEIERILAGVVSEDEKEVAPDSEHLH